MVELVKKKDKQTMLLDHTQGKMRLYMQGKKKWNEIICPLRFLHPANYP
jgi:hypothetical protein